MSKTGYVYLMKNNRNGYVKIGFTTKEPEFREKTLASEDPDISLIHRQYGLTMKEEKEIHRLNADKRLRGEWFDLSEDEVDLIIIKLQRMFIKKHKSRESSKSKARSKLGGDYATAITNELLYDLYRSSTNVTVIGDKTVIAFDKNHPLVEKVLRVFDKDLNNKYISQFEF